MVAVIVVIVVAIWGMQTRTRLVYEPNEPIRNNNKIRKTPVIVVAAVIVGDMHKNECFFLSNCRK